MLCNISHISRYRQHFSESFRKKLALEIVTLFSFFDIQLSLFSYKNCELQIAYINQVNIRYQPNIKLQVPLNQISYKMTSCLEKCDEIARSKPGKI